MTDVPVSAAGRIAVLPREAAERIAAGEVVERPASVVKELVENSVDAGASRITVEVEGAGLGLIRVVDDGTGIAGDDLPRAFHRFATSKIRSADDLARIETYGFRGEALPSIAAVARVEVVSAPPGAPASRMRIDGGAARAAEPGSAPPGTTMEVRALFFNTPARRKFLKSPAREMSLIVEIAQGLALGAPAVAFRLVSDGRELLWYPAEGFAERARRVLGPAAAGALDLDAGVTGGSLQAVLGVPQTAQPRRSHQWFLINRRPVRSPLLARALSQAYHTLVPDDRHPAAVLSLRLPPAEIDANVHPRKAEVRVVHEARLFDDVVRGIGQVLRRTGLAHVVQGGGSRADGGAAWSVPAAFAPRGVEAGRRAEDGRSGGGEAGVLPLLPQPPRGWPAVRVVGQLALTYIITEAGEDLLLVDQHAAHERVLFERLMRRRGEEGIRSQGLLAPAVVAVSPSEEAAFEECADALSGLGYGVEAFGPGLIRLTAVPAIPVRRAPEAMFRACLRDLVEDAWTSAAASLAERLAIATACHTAVRAGDRLDPSVMMDLIDALGRCRDPYSCFHGRPTMVRVPRAELERWFYRRE